MAVQSPVDLLRPLLQPVEDVAPAGDEQLNAGEGGVQLGGDADELSRHQGPVLVHPADIGEDGFCRVQSKLPDDVLAGEIRGELLGVDAVDGHRDVVRVQAVLPDEVGLDIVRDGDGALPPVGEVAQDPLGVEDPVGGGDKGKLPSPAQPAAQEGGDTGVGVDHIGPLLVQDTSQRGPGLAHFPKTAAVEGGLVVADAGGGDLRDVDPPVGDDGDVVPLMLQLLGQLHDVGLRSADAQPHSGHEDFHKMPMTRPSNRAYLV